jgi:hypothetical protein
VSSWLIYPQVLKFSCFFYPGDLDSHEIKERLRAFGNATGDNLFVNIGSLADRDYKSAVKRFGIQQLPVIIVTAVAPLAASPQGATAYVRLDAKALFSRPEELTKTVAELFNLFLGEKIIQAMVTGWSRESIATVAAATDRVWAVIHPVITWVAHKDIKLEFATAKIEVKESGSG